MVPVDGLLRRFAACPLGCRWRSSDCARRAQYRTDCDGRRFELWRSGAFGESDRFGVFANYGAGGRIRTADPRITNALLYHLSYTGIGCEAAYYKWNSGQREPVRAPSGRSFPAWNQGKIVQGAAERSPGGGRRSGVPAVYMRVHEECEHRRTPPAECSVVPWAIFQSLVTRFNSTRLIEPLLTLFSAARRRSMMPSTLLCRSISSAVPPCRMNRSISSVMGITWKTPERPL